MDEKTIRVLLADDHPVARAGIRAILETAPDIEIVGEAQNGAEVKRMVKALRPHVLLLDLVMPGTRPLELEKWVRTHYPQTTTVVLTGHDHDYYLAGMLEAGVTGYLTKNEAPDKLVDAIRCAARGQPFIVGGRLAQAIHWREAVGARWESLTHQERRVLRLLAEGKDNKAIAQRLGVTTKAVAYHVANILNKLGVGSRLEAVAWVHENLPEDLVKIPG